MKTIIKIRIVQVSKCLTLNNAGIRIIKKKMNKKGENPIHHVKNVNEVKVRIVLVDSQHVTDQGYHLHNDSDYFHNQNTKYVLSASMQKAKNKSEKSDSKYQSRSW